MARISCLAWAHTAWSVPALGICPPLPLLSAFALAAPACPSRYIPGLLLILLLPPAVDTACCPIVATAVALLLTLLLPCCCHCCCHCCCPAVAIAVALLLTLLLLLPIPTPALVSLSFYLCLPPLLHLLPAVTPCHRNGHHCLRPLLASPCITCSHFSSLFCLQLQPLLQA